MKRRPLQRITALALALLVAGAAGAESLRSCPHHGQMEGHGFAILYGSDAPPLGDAGHAGHEASDTDRDGAAGPLHDPGPCEHNLGVCETVTSGLVLSADVAELLPQLGPVEWITSDPGEAAPSAEPSFLLPYSIGPPLLG